jgi:3-methyladenine DNA glycosylase AlkC
VITKVAQIRPLLDLSRRQPAAAIPQLRQLAGSDSWQTREVAATALVEISKRHPEVVLSAARRWARDRDPNVRRAASEGLRGVVQRDPDGVRPILERLRADPDLYVRKSVANVLRNASRAQPDFVLRVCTLWAQSDSPETRWISREGLRKLKTLRPREVAAILKSLARSA